MVPDGVEEVELARIKLEQKEREQKLVLDDIRKLSTYVDSGDVCLEKEGDLWIITGGRSALVRHERVKYFLVRSPHTCNFCFLQVTCH